MLPRNFVLLLGLSCFEKLSWFSKQVFAHPIWGELAGALLCSLGLLLAVDAAGDGLVLRHAGGCVLLRGGGGGAGQEQTNKEAPARDRLVTSEKHVRSCLH